MPSASSREEARTALNEIVAAGRTKKRQERWVVLGGLLQQGKRNLSYEEIRELAGYHAERGGLPPGCTNAQASHVREQKRQRRKPS